VPLVILDEVKDPLAERLSDAAMGGDVTEGSSRNGVISTLVAALGIRLASHLGTWMLVQNSILVQDGGCRVPQHCPDRVGVNATRADGISGIKIRANYFLCESSPITASFLEPLDDTVV
jgi:hypothetical protein